jgi:HlyD family secretion protein
MTTRAAPKTKPAKRKISPWWALLLVPVGFVALSATGVLRSPNAASQAAAPKVETAQVTRGLFRVSVTGPGTLEAADALDVKPSVQGTIAKLPKVGQRVQKGELIAQLETDTFARALENAELSLEKAQAQLVGTRSTQANNRASQQSTITSSQAQFENAGRDLTTAQTNYTNAKRLFDVGGGTQQAVTDARTQLEKAQASLETARVALNTARSGLNLKGATDVQDIRNLEIAVRQAQITVKNARTDLAKTKVYAPISGVISSVPAQVGGPASSGAALFTMLNDRQVNLPVQIDETEIGKVKVGQRAEVTLDALEGEKYLGKVTRVSPQARIVSNIAIFDVTVTLDNPELKLRPGMSAEAEVIAQEIPGAVQVPRRAVERVRSRAYVTVQPAVQSDAPEGSAKPELERVRVQTGADDGTNIVITEGLRGGETVILPTRDRATTNQGGGLPGIGGGGRR